MESRELPASCHPARCPALQSFVYPNSGPGRSGPHCASSWAAGDFGLVLGPWGCLGGFSKSPVSSHVTCFSPHYPHHEECLEVGHTERTRPGQDPRHPQATPSQSTESAVLVSLCCSSRSLGLGATVLTVSWGLGRGVRFCSGTSSSSLAPRVLPWGAGCATAGRRCRPGPLICPQALVDSWQDRHKLPRPSQLAREREETLAGLVRPRCPPPRPRHSDPREPHIRGCVSSPALVRQWPGHLVPQ